MPISGIERIVFDTTNVVTGEITRHAITPTDGYSGRFYHYDDQYINTRIEINGDKFVMGRAYATNTNVIEQVDDIKLVSITYGGITNDRITPILQ